MQPSRPRPAYVEERIALQRQIAEHRRQAPKTCICPWCLDAELVHDLLARKLAANHGRGEEVPF